MTLIRHFTYMSFKNSMTKPLQLGRPKCNHSNYRSRKRGLTLIERRPSPRQANDKGNKVALFLRASAGINVLRHWCGFWRATPAPPLLLCAATRRRFFLSGTPVTSCTFTQCGILFLSTLHTCVCRSADSCDVPILHASLSVVHLWRIFL